uniref:Uncharacterized protein n=1 Tax=Ditylenchus dipsaci TaxID=166011 RepID=A0A915DGV4_9BILA
MSNSEQDGSGSRKRKAYPTEKKLQAVDYANKYSKVSASRKFNFTWSKLPEDDSEDPAATFGSMPQNGQFTYGHHPPRRGGSNPLLAKLPPDIDLEGGTLLSVEEREEVDPEDNCKVHITTFHILSADRTEESTLTKKRKLKVNCTQSLKRVEFVNGKEAKFEEKTTILDNSDALRQYPSVGGQSLALQHSNSAQDLAINDVLMRTQDTFLSLLNEKRDQLVKMFPELFSNLRTQPAIFDAPSTIMETIQNPDGSTTTRTKSSKAFSPEQIFANLFLRFLNSHELY